MSHLGDWFFGVPSQNFEDEFDRFDSVAADDFRVERRCRARALVVDGSYGGSTGPAVSETVTFYRDGGGKPGRPIRSETVVGANRTGWSFDIDLDRMLRLRPGRTYWISTQVNMDFLVGGQWQAAMRDTFDGARASWNNPGDGFETGCVHWTPAVECAEEWTGDLVFEIRTR